MAKGMVREEDPASVSVQVQRVFMEKGMVREVDPASERTAASKLSAAGVIRKLFKGMIMVLFIMVISGEGMYRNGTST
jgi:hypothetical protein